MLSVRSAASRVHLRSRSGLNAGAALAPTAPEFVIPTFAGVGEASTPAPCGRGCVLWLPRSSGSTRAPQSCMRPHWQTQAGDSNRAHAGSSVS